MKSALAVAGQIILSASNFIVFLVFTSLLTMSDFVLFSTAVGLSILAYSVAEGGVSFVAPKEITAINENRDAMVGAFVFVCVLLYSLSIFVGFFLWNLLSQEPLDLAWVLSYALYFLPVMFMPSWVTFRTIKLDNIIVLSVSRVITILFIYFNPNLTTLLVAAVLNLATSLWILGVMNRRKKTITVPSITDIYSAIRKLKQVFLSKTFSYVIYSSIPLVVAALYGNSISAIYILGERLKSMYSTLFQPFIQTIYLWQLQKKNKQKHPYDFIFIVSALNLFVLFLMFLALQNGLLNLFVKRFNDIENIEVYMVAAFLSVQTSILLYFKVFPLGLFKVFRVSTYIQVITFLSVFVLMYISFSIPPAFILAIGEMSILLAVIIQLYSVKSKTVSEIE